MYTALINGRSHSLHCVMKIVSQSLVDFAVKTNRGATLTEVAVTNDHGDSVECLKILASVGGVDCNVKMKRGGDTPIMWCLKKKKIEMLNVLDCKL